MSGAEEKSPFANVDEPHIQDDPASHLLARFTESPAIRKLARGLAGELLLVDHEGDIVDPTIDPRIFTKEPEDLCAAKYAHTTLLMSGDAYLPGCLVVGAALRFQVQTKATLVCLVDDKVSSEARDMLGRVYDRVVEVERLRAHETSYPEHLLSEAYRDVYTKLHLFDSNLLPYERLTFIDADLLPLRCFDHLFTLKAPAAVIESVHPTSQYAYVQHMHGVRHGEPVPASILEVTSEDDIRGGVNAGLLVIEPSRDVFEDYTARIKRPMVEWGPKHREHFEAGIRYGFPEQHFLQVEMQKDWTAVDPRFNCMRTDVPHSFGIHWMIGRKPWQNHANPGRTVSQGLWVIAWETLRLHHPEMCADLERHGLVTDKPKAR